MDPLLYRRGQRIRLLSMGEDPEPISVGSTGTIEKARYFDWPMANPGFWRLDVRWDNRRYLAVIIPPDRIEVIGGC